MSADTEPDTPRLLLTVEEAAEALSLGKTKAYELIRDGQLSTVRIGRARRVPIEALDAFVASLRAADGRAD